MKKFIYILLILNLNFSLSQELIIGEERVDPGIVFIFEGAIKDEIHPKSLHLDEDETNVHIEARVNWNIENMERISKGQVKSDGYPDSIFRIKDRKPLLVIHFLDLFKTKESNRHLCDLEDFAHTTWSISFPPTKYEQDKTDYIVNKVWIQQNFFNNLSEQEEDELRGSDGN